MNYETGISCPLPGCPDTGGTMPACAGLAVSYVPFQQENPEQYSQQDALRNGTLFPGLNLPFYLKSEAGAVPNTALTELQALEFVVMELGIYLDTHPQDSEAFAMFQKYTAMEKQAKALYEEQHGPLTKQAAANGKTYRWLESPWPWCPGANEVK